MKRTRMPPGKPIARTTPVKRVNKARKAAAFERAYGGAERVDFVRALPCVICHAVPSENAHVQTGGMGRKSDARHVVSLCRIHHTILHVYGREAIEDEYAINLDAEAAKIEAAWTAHQQETTP